MLYLMKTNYYYCGIQCSVLLYQFFMELHRVVNLQNGSQESQKLNQLAPVMEYIDKNYKNDITLVDLADLVDLSPQYLCRLFKECLSIRPFEYLARKRVQQAKILLLEGKWNINEIASMVGYNDCSYFCAVFKRHEMLSPAEFRSLHRKGISEHSARVIHRAVFYAFFMGCLITVLSFSGAVFLASLKYISWCRRLSVMSFIYP